MPSGEGDEGASREATKEGAAVASWMTVFQAPLGPVGGGWWMVVVCLLLSPRVTLKCPVYIMFKCEALTPKLLGVRNQLAVDVVKGGMEVGDPRVCLQNRGRADTHHNSQEEPRQRVPARARHGVFVIQRSVPATQCLCRSAGERPKAD